MPDTDIAVIGAGAAGREVAALSVALGLRVALFERGPMGAEGPTRGRMAAAALRDCARRAAETRDAARFGLRGEAPTADWTAVRARMREAVTAASPEAEAARFEGMGVEVVRAAARFAAPDRVAAAGREWRFRRCVVATGAAPVVPDLPGLESVPFLTAGTIFGLDAAPGHLIVLGGGGFGLEMAQAHARLGWRATVIAAGRIAPDHAPELADGLARVLRSEGIVLLEGQPAAKADRVEDGVVVTLADGVRVKGTHLLLALGRAPAVAGLDLMAGNVAGGPRGIAVTPALRSTTNRRVWAVGGVAQAPEGWPEDVSVGDPALLLRTMLFRLPGGLGEAAPLRAVHTDPGLVSLGADAAEGAGRLLRAPLGEGAAAEGTELGLVRLITDGRGRLRGAGVLAPRAAEMAGLLALAVAQKVPMDALAGLDLPSPSLADAVRRAARSFYAPLAAAPMTHRIVRLTTRLP